MSSLCQAWHLGGLCRASPVPFRACLTTPPPAPAPKRRGGERQGLLPLSLQGRGRGEGFSRRPLRPHPIRTRSHQFGAPLVLPDERGCPVAFLVTLDAPQLLAGFRIQGRQKRFLLVVIDDEDAALVQHRRRRGAPAESRLKAAPLLGPQFLAVEVVAEQA